MMIKHPFPRLLTYCFFPLAYCSFSSAHIPPPFYKRGPIYLYEDIIPSQDVIMREYARTFLDIVIWIGFLLFLILLGKLAITLSTEGMYKAIDYKLEKTNYGNTAGDHDYEPLSVNPLRDDGPYGGRLDRKDSKPKFGEENP